MNAVDPLAPNTESVVDYDRRNLALYAALLDADDGGSNWREVAASLMRIDVSRDEAERCWRSHLDRARWVIGEGLAAALVAFNQRAVR